MVVVEEAFAYVTHENRLLVFEQPDYPAAGLQVPAGTIRQEERPEQAALREAREESGLLDYGPIAFLGLQEFDARPFGKQELHRRHFYHLPYLGAPTSAWQHSELDPSDGTPSPISFRLFWIEVCAAADALVAEHGKFLHLLPERVPRRLRKS